jgi:DNA-nicking Smr family endonuclease
MPKKSVTHSTEDLVLWQRVASQVTPLKSTTHSASFSNLGSNVTNRQSKVLTKNVRTKKRMVLDDISLRPTGTISKKDSLKYSGPVDLRHGEKAGVDGSTQRRLFRGEILIDLRLDLHGMTAARAHKRLIQFIVSAAADGFRCVLVITGKGSGVLNGYVPNWLKQPPLSPHVLALAEARPKDGGSGAFYVLLRRKRGHQ